MKHLTQILTHRAYRLPLLAVLLLVAGIKLAILPTWELYQENDKLNAKAKLITDVAYHPGYQQRKLRELDSIISLYKVDPLNWQARSMQVIGLLAEKEGIRIVDLPAKDSDLRDSSSIALRALTLEGSFAGLTRVYRQLQKERGIGVVRSATYHLVGREVSTDTQHLQLVLYWEWLKKSE
jgi:hypothetical protein